MWGMRLATQPVDVLRSHPVKTLVIHGRADAQIPIRVAESIASAAGTALIGAHYLDGVEHMQAVAWDKEWYLRTLDDAVYKMTRAASSA